MPRTSNKRDQIYEFLISYMKEHGYAPSIRDICEAVNLKSTATVHYHLRELKRSGQIEIDENKKRSISLPAIRSGLQIPVVGVVTAGLPILATENIEGYIPWDGDTNCFALRVRGDSMTGAGILDGDTVIIRPQPTALEGQIVVALLGDEATVKRIHFENNTILLMPENPNYRPINGTDASILGIVKAVMREYF